MSRNNPNDVLLYKSDFSANAYTSKVLSGLRYRLIRDKNLLLIPGTDYVTYDIGFTLSSFTMEDDTTISIQFY